MRPLYSPSNEAELAVVRSVLDAEKIAYFVQNDHFGSLRPGPRIPLYNVKTVFVDDEDLARAKEAIANTALDSAAVAETPGAPDLRYSFFDKARMFFEVLLFGWIMPGKRRSEHDVQSTSNKPVQADRATRATDLPDVSRGR